MSTPDALSLKNSSLNAFLFAEVGTELNGSPLTILSVLARLGEDPWVEAAKWTKLPKAATIDRLAHSIAQMPLPPQALQDARKTASRLITLLPPPPVAEASEAPSARRRMASWWVLVAACGAALALGFALTMMRGAQPGGAVTSIRDLPAAKAPARRP